MRGVLCIYNRLIKGQLMLLDVHSGTHGVNFVINPSLHAAQNFYLCRLIVLKAQLLCMFLENKWCLKQMFGVRRDWMMTFIFTINRVGIKIVVAGFWISFNLYIISIDRPQTQ